MQSTGLRSDLTSMCCWCYFRTKLTADLCLSELGKRAELASHGGSETGGHSHGTRTHQQVLVMGVILRLRVKGGDGQGAREGERGRSGDTNEQRWMRTPWGGGDRESRGRGRQRDGRSLLIHMPDITITLLIQWDTNTDEVRVGEPKQRLGKGGQGVGWVGERQMGDNNSYRVPTFIKFKHLSMNVKDSKSACL